MYLISMGKKVIALKFFLLAFLLCFSFIFSPLNVFASTQERSFFSEAAVSFSEGFDEVSFLYRSLSASFFSAIKDSFLNFLGIETPEEEKEEEPQSSDLVTKAELQQSLLLINQSLNRTIYQPSDSPVYHTYNTYVTEGGRVSVTDGLARSVARTTSDLSDEVSILEDQVESVIQTALTDSDDLPEGLSNLYYTDTRVGSYLSASTTLRNSINYWQFDGDTLTYVGTTTVTGGFSADNLSLSSPLAISSGGTGAANATLARANINAREATDLVFYDDFERADVGPGDIGTSPTGHTYSVDAGAEISDGYLINGHYNWVDDLDFTPEVISWNFSMVPGNGGDSYVYAMLMPQVDHQLSEMFHMVWNGSQWGITIWHSFFDQEEVLTGVYSSPLRTDGTSYSFRVEFLGNDTIVVTDPEGKVWKTTHAGLDDYVTPYVAFEQANDDAQILTRFDSVYISGSPSPELSYETAAWIDTSPFVRRYETVSRDPSTGLMRASELPTTVSQIKSSTWTSGNATLTGTSTTYLGQTGSMSAFRVVFLPAASSVPRGHSVTVADESGTASVANFMLASAVGSDVIISSAGTSTSYQLSVGPGIFISNGTDRWTVITSPLNTTNIWSTAQTFSVGASVRAPNSSSVAFTVQGTSSQSANLQRWVDSAGAVQASIAFDGTGYFAGSLTSGGLRVGNVSEYARLTVKGGSFQAGASFSAGAGDLNDIIQLRNSSNTQVGSVSPVGLLRLPLGLTGAPSFSFYNDTDTGMWSSAANTLNFSTGGTERLTINTSGNIGIGSTTPSAKLSIHELSGSVGTASLFKIASSTSAGTGTTTLFTVLGNGGVGIGTALPSTLLHVSGPITGGYISKFESTAASNWNAFVSTGGIAEYGINSDALYFKANDTLSGGIQFLNNSANNVALQLATNNNVLLVQTSGNVGIGTTTPAYKLHVAGDDGSGNVAKFQTSGGLTSCTLNGTTGLLNCSSDERLKKDIESLEASSTLEKILELNPVAYHWKTDSSSSTLKYGFIAQELEGIFPELVATDKDSGMKSLSLSGLVPFIVSAVQDIAKKVDMVISIVGGKTKIQADTLCAGSVCVTQEELQQLLENVQTNSAPTPQELADNDGGNDAVPDPIDSVPDDAPSEDIVDTSPEESADEVSEPEEPSSEEEPAEEPLSETESDSASDDVPSEDEPAEESAPEPEPSLSDESSDSSSEGEASVE